jgi:uncharacterized membrane protein YbhN (UPF0104 family)
MSLGELFHPQTQLERDRSEFVLVVAVAAALSLGAIVGVAWAAGFANVWHTLRNANWIWFLAALGGQALAYAGYTFAYREVARLEHGPELELPQAAALVAVGFGAFLAPGGFAVDMDALRRAGLSRREARLRVFGLGALEYAVLAPAAFVSAIVILSWGVGEPGPSLTIPWIAGFAGGSVVALLMLWKREQITASKGWRRTVGEALNAIAVVPRLFGRSHLYGLAFAAIALYWFGDIFCLWACVQAFGGERPLPDLILAYATGYALTRRTLPLGGAGAVPALLPFALVWAGIPLATAVLGVAAYQVFNFWLPLLPAIPGLAAVKRIRRPRQRTRARAA